MNVIAIILVSNSKPEDSEVQTIHGEFDNYSDDFNAGDIEFFDVPGENQGG